MQKILDLFGFLTGGVSDIYVYANSKILYKAHQEVHEAGYVDSDAIASFIHSLLSQSKRDLLNQGIEQDVALEFGGFFFRVHIFLSQGSPALFFRILPKEILPVFDHPHFDFLKPKIAHQKGLFLIAGATGSGKTTLANAILDYFNTHFHKHIVSIEEPVEFKHQNKQSFFTFREVGRDTRSFASGIVSAMRQSPDVIFIGELREPIAMQSALLAALTGHFVLATLHSKDTTGALLRFLSGFEDRKRASNELAESLIGVIAQRRNKDAGAEFEILSTNTAIKNLIKEEKFHQIPSQIAISSNEGMRIFGNGGNG
ncbi:twitching mobility protein [Helicobacter mustelae]|uniref:type IV pilus twitching motility protein PilT n=1 Tax=Helicobacter mustelae TaxID=217 RepID=UPI000E045A19|nr:ATPase, T2SS/T4P/T4SS family [Helicobacter mustelae]STP13025.1 twitching mobility protein [Helicobacter mustelae]